MITIKTNDHTFRLIGVYEDRLKYVSSETWGDYCWRDKRIEKTFFLEINVFGLNFLDTCTVDVSFLSSEFHHSYIEKFYINNMDDLVTKLNEMKLGER